MPAAEAFTLAERDNIMSEQEKPKSYMQELNQWIKDEVIDPLWYRSAFGEDPDAGSAEDISDRVYAAIRAKVLESYRNGQAAGPKTTKPFRKESQYAQAKTR